MVKGINRLGFVKMKVNSVVSADGLQVIDIVEKTSGIYSLQCYTKKHDPEEDCEYIVRVLPDPDGIFSDVSSATVEANRILTS